MNGCKDGKIVFKKEEYAYGIEPNKFLAQQLNHFKPGKILFGLKVKEETPFMQLKRAGMFQLSTLVLKVKIRP